MAGVLFGYFGFMALARTPVEQSSEAANLIGASVYAAEGTEVGEVSAVTVGQDGQIHEIRVTTSLPLGLGERTVVVRHGSFIAMRGAVVLEFSAEEVDALPTPSILRSTSV